MTAAELKRAASRVLAHCTESKSRMKRTLIEQETDVIEILRAVASGTVAFWDNRAQIAMQACDQNDSEADRLVIGGGDVPSP